MKFVSAGLPVNKFKNRLVNILPCKSFFYIQHHQPELAKL